MEAEVEEGISRDQEGWEGEETSPEVIFFAIFNALYLLHLFTMQIIYISYVLVT